MRFLVYGAGAVGSLLGGLLGRAGHSVTLLGRDSHMHAIQSRGLSIRGVWGSHHVKGLQTATQWKEVRNQLFDVLFLTVKSYDTAVAIESIRSFGTVPSTIVSVQNGYGNVEALETAFGRGCILGARIITGVELPEPSQVLVTVSADDIRIGPPSGESGSMSSARSIAGICRDASIPTSATDQYCQYLWAKILYNCALNPLGALLRATYGELVQDRQVCDVIDQIIDEAFSVTCALRIPLFWDSSLAYRRHFFEELIPPTSGHYPSMLRDLDSRGCTEIDSLNGAVTRLGRRAQLDVSMNETLTAMVKFREKTRRIEMQNRVGGESSGTTC